MTTPSKPLLFDYHTDKDSHSTVRARIPDVAAGKRTDARSLSSSPDCSLIKSVTQNGFLPSNTLGSSLFAVTLQMRLYQCRIVRIVEHGLFDFHDYILRIDRCASWSRHVYAYLRVNLYVAIRSFIRFYFIRRLRLRALFRISIERRASYFAFATIVGTKGIFYATLLIRPNFLFSSNQNIFNSNLIHSSTSVRYIVSITMNFDYDSIVDNRNE